jgi:phosphatidylserine/phosphatidylglycerophosphate/cardiolipin synthase-like enzyme
MRFSKSLSLLTTLMSVFFLSTCSDSSAPTRPDRPAVPPHEKGPSKLGKADTFDWGSGCSGGSGSFNQDIEKDAVVTVGTIPKDKANVEIKLTCDKDVDIQLYDEDGTAIVQWPDGIFNDAEKETQLYKGVRITYSGYNGDGQNLGHESIKIEGVLPVNFVMKAYGYAAGQARINYSWEAKPGCVDSGGSGSFQKPIEKDAVVTVGDIIEGLTDVKVKLTSPVDIDIQLYDGDTKVVHWSEGLLKGPTKVTRTYKNMKITWSGYNGDGTGKGNEFIEIEGKTTAKLTLKVYGYEAGTATVDYSWGGGGGSGGSVEAKAIFSPTSTSKSHVAEVVKLIGGAQKSVDIAMYSLSDNRVFDALKQAIDVRHVKVRFIYHGAQEDRKDPPGTKSAKLEDKGVDVRYATKSKVMHHKMMIVDGPRKDAQGNVDMDRAKTAWLVTGSGNWSGGAQTNYDENTVFIKGAPELVLRYQKEFNRLWNWSHDFTWKTFTYEKAADDIDPASVPDDPSVHALFTSKNFKKNLSFTVIKGSYAVATDLVKELEKANQSIYVASGHFRSWPIYDALVKLKQQKPHLDIKVYLDGQEYISDWYNNKQLQELQTCLNAAGSDAAKQEECRRSGMYYARELDKAGVSLRFKYYCYRWDYHYAKQMHNKYVIIDGRTVLTGSYNFSDNAELGTLENVVILTGAPYQALVQKFMYNFNTLWKTDQDGSLLGGLKQKIQSDPTIPLVFSPMALTWDQVTEVRGLIEQNCPHIFSEDYKKNPQNHKTCPRN